MTLEKMLSVYDQQIEVEISKLDGELDQRIVGATSMLVGKGMMASSAALFQMGDIAADSVEARALMAIKISSQCAEAAHIELNASNVEALTSRMKEWLKEQAQLASEKIGDTPSLKRMEQENHLAHNIVQERLELMSKKVDADFAFMAMRATSASDAGINGPNLAPVISVTGPVGVIQTGNQNIANVSQRLDEGMIEALRDALTTMSEQLAQDGGHPDFQEAVDLAVSELSKAQPNKTILAGIMTSIKQTVEFTPKLQRFADTIAPYLPMLGLS